MAGRRYEEAMSQPKESPSDMYSRVQEMVRDNGETWDLSDNDKHALRHVLGLVNLMAEGLAEREETPAAEILRLVGQRVYQIQMDGP